MIIDCISDLHGHYPELDGGDLLIVAGDLTANDTSDQLIDFYYWITDQKYKKKIFISGNHDNLLIDKKPFFLNPDVKIEYLCDSGTEFEYEEYYSPHDSLSGITQDVLCCRKKKLKIWGSPWTKTFEGINSACKAFTCDTEEELAEKWKLIPNDIDILITHSPPYGILDLVPYRLEHVGSISLHKEGSQRIRSKLNIFGHIHEAYGQCQITNEFENITYKFVNASHVNERYKPVNKPIRVIL